MDKWQIFTPDTYVEKMLDIIGYSGDAILDKTVLENSCGSGNILVKVVERFIYEALNKKYSKYDIVKLLSRNIVGFEIDKDVREECIKNLNNITEKFSLPEVHWTIYETDYLLYEVDERFDFIIGNPPYITYQELNNEQRKVLKNNFISCQKGKFDYCYPFIEKSIKSLNEDNGKLVYLIPSSIFKNVFGRNLREILKPDLSEVHDFRNIKIFENALVSASLIYVDKTKKTNTLEYVNVFEKERVILPKNELGEKWDFVDSKKIAKNGNFRLGDYFKISNSVATLLNEVFVITDFEEVNSKFIKNGQGYLIEKEVLRDAASPRSKAYSRKEVIIFPYYFEDGKLLHFTEKEFLEKFPKAYEYLWGNKQKLLKRKSDMSSQWFEYGRSQALQYMNQPKLLLSSVITHQVNVYKLEKNTIPYSGFYLIPKKNLELDFAKDILESPGLFEYISVKGISASGKSLRFSVTDFLDYKF